MSNSSLDENLRRLFDRCTPRLTADDLDRALARFEGRRRPAAPHARVLAAAAAAVLVGCLLGWLALSPSRKPTAGPAQQTSPEEIARLIADLGAAAPEVREKAQKQLVAIGPAALGPLERAIYHENPEVRVASQNVVTIVRRAEEIRPTLEFNRAAIKIARARWTARSFTDLEVAVTEAFDPDEPPTVHYVPRKSVGTSFEMGRDGGDKDRLTPEIVAALDRGDGIVYLDGKGKPVDLGPLCLFTLPDKVGWSAYVIADLMKRDPEDVFFISVVVAEGEGDLAFQAEGLAPRPEGGLKILDVSPNGTFARVFKKGDVLLSVNGKAPAGLRDLEPLCVAAPKPVVLMIERDGKVFPAGVRVLARIVIKPSATMEQEAQAAFEQAEKAYDQDPKLALRLYGELLTKYSGTEFLTTARKEHIRQRIGVLKER
jgi:hypothetical protein